MKSKHIVIVSTPVYKKSFTQVTCMMTDQELEDAKLERPDLMFMKANDLPVEDSIQEVCESLPDSEQLPPLTEEQGITVKGMTLPHNLDDLIVNLFKE